MPVPSRRRIRASWQRIPDLWLIAVLILIGAAALPVTAPSQPASPAAQLAPPQPAPPPPGAKPTPPPMLHGRFLAAEDTIPFVSAADTVLVTAPRIKVSDIIRAIGERMRADDERMGDHAWTSITKLVARKQHPGNGKGADWTEIEIVQRQLHRRDGAFESVRLRQTETKYKDGKLDKHKIDDDVKSNWQQLSETAQAIPFSLESGDEYNYDILHRDIIGDHLVYTIRFAPKSQFKALPAGTVWVDCNDFVIRRVEANLTEAVPLPMLIKSIPFMKARQVRRGDFWVMDDFMAKVLLRKAVPGLPTSVELYVRNCDHVINGVAYPEGAVADAGGAGGAGGPGAAGAIDPTRAPLVSSAADTSGAAVPDSSDAAVADSTAPVMADSSTAVKPATSAVAKPDSPASTKSDASAASSKRGR